MNKKIFIVFFFLLAITSAQAQLLWKISGNGLKHTSYLFGTHHLIPIAYLDSVPGLFSSFNACETVVGEMVMNNIDATSKIQQAALMPDHITMKDLYNANEYKMVDSVLKSTLKIGLKEMAMMKPTLIQTMFEMEIYKKSMEYASDMQSDSYFQLVAAEKGKKIVGLETTDQQINILFGDTSMQRQADLLLKSVQNKDSIIHEIKQLNSLYKKGLIDELVKNGKGTGKPSDMTKEEYALMVDNRNAEWISKLPELMNENSCFIAVGAMHLGGENGLVKKLRKAGYQVKAVK